MGLKFLKEFPEDIFLGVAMESQFIKEEV